MNSEVEIWGALGVLGFRVEGLGFLRAVGISGSLGASGILGVLGVFRGGEHALPL